MHRVRYPAVPILLSLACLAVPALGAPAAVVPGAVVKPNGVLPLRDAPPQGLFSFKGDQIGTIGTGSSYGVVETKIVPTLFGNETWVRVQNKTDPSQTGWIYTGSDARPFQNVTRQR